MNAFRMFNRGTFAALSIHNFRWYFIGMSVSLCGTWMQTVALGWLVLELSGSGTQLGGVLAFQFFPVLVGGLFAGAMVDAFDKRRILYVTQSSLGALALVVSALVYTDLMQLWMLYVFALSMGCINALDNPARQTFVHEMVGRDHIRNAVTLNSVAANAARAVGPLFAGSLIAGVGIAFCFFVNALSFLAVLIILFLLRTNERRVESTERGDLRGILEVFRYVATKPEIKRILLVMGLIGMLAYEFQVSLPLLAQRVYHGDASSYAMLLSAMGVGSVIGGLFIAGRKKVSSREFALSVLLFGLSICATASMPTFFLAVLGMVFVGYFSINISSVGNTIIQLESHPHMRGRVMSLWSMAIFGTTLIGAPIIGYVAEIANARIALALGGLSALIASVLVLIDMHGRDRIFSLLEYMRIRRGPRPIFLGEWDQTPQK